MPLTKEELDRILQEEQESLGISAPETTSIGGIGPSVSPELGEFYRPFTPEEQKAGWGALWSMLHGTARGMTFGGSEKLLNLIFGKREEKEQPGFWEYKKLAPESKTAGEFAGQLFPLTRAIRLGGWLTKTLPGVRRLPQLGRATLSNILAGAGLGAVELGMLQLLAFVGIGNSVAYPLIIWDRVIAHWSQIMLGMVLIIFSRSVNLKIWQFEETGVPIQKEV